MTLLAAFACRLFLLLLCGGSFICSAAGVLAAPVSRVSSISSTPPATVGPPIPARWPAGHPVPAALNSTAAAPAILVEAFYDHICPDSAASWPALKAVAAEYAARGVQVVVHELPLPYHRNAFYAAQGGLVVMQNAASASASAVGKANGGGGGGSSSSSDAADALWIKWLDAMFAAQPQFSNELTHTDSAAQVVKLMAGVAQDCCGVSHAAFEKGMQYGDPLGALARLRWKNGVARGVYGTPTFFINGALATSDNWSVQQWRDMLDNLLAQQQ